jgi:hypothetical protein
MEPPYGAKGRETSLPRGEVMTIVNTFRLKKKLPHGKFIEAVVLSYKVKVHIVDQHELRDSAEKFVLAI